MKTVNHLMIKTMAISEKELKDDFWRFIRHEAMRANISQDEVLDTVTEIMEERWKSL